MNSIAIFDIGKTNKKFLIFDQHLNLLHQEEKYFDAIVDEDGFACDDITEIEKWILECVHKNQSKWKIKAINFSTYGATLVYLDANGNRLTPLYNYLKEIPTDFLENFYARNGGKTEFARNTASPILGMLNSGIQMVWLKIHRPQIYQQVKNIVHFPQYLSFLFTAKIHSDYTSIGCHTALWDFDKQTYHHWLNDEPIQMPIPVNNSKVESILFNRHHLKVGVGIHDSSASLVPYLMNSQHPFVLISTGTWCIFMNPFNPEPLTRTELESDCLCYLSTLQKPVKSSRFFMGHFHDLQVKLIADHFKLSNDFYKSVHLDEVLLMKTLHEANQQSFHLKDFAFDTNPNLENYENAIEAYYRLMVDLTLAATGYLKLVLSKTDTTQSLYITGGFSKNPVFTCLLATIFNDKQVFTSKIENASALGAAMVITEPVFGFNPNPDLNLKAINGIRFKPDNMMESLSNKIHQNIVETLTRIYKRGFTTTSGGNISVIDEKGNIWITPSAIDKGNLKLTDIVCIKSNGEITGLHKPSSEYPFHQQIFKNRTDIKAVIHAHPPGLVAFSIAGKTPDTHTILHTKNYCGKLGFAKYALPGSNLLGIKIADEFNKGFSAVIMENHGIVVGGTSLDDAYSRFESLEFCAQTILAGNSLGIVKVCENETLGNVQKTTSSVLPSSVLIENPMVHEICFFAKRACEQGLIAGSGGLISMRMDENSFLVTKPGILMWNVTANDIVPIFNSHETVDDEVLLHIEIYKNNPKVNSIITAQPVYLMAFAITHSPINVRTIPESWIFLQDIPVYPMNVNHKEVSQNLAPAQIISNRCVVVTGDKLLQTFDRLEVAEFSAKSIVIGKTLGNMIPINDDQIEELRIAFNVK